MADIEEQLKRSYWIQETLSSILKLSLEPISLKEQLERALDLILSIPWLSLESKGCIFLVDEDRRSLILTVQNGVAGGFADFMCQNTPWILSLRPGSLHR